MPTHETYQSSTGQPEHVVAPITQDKAVQPLKHGPVGALVVAAVAVGLLFIGWIAFYFLIFVPRGPVG